MGCWLDWTPSLAMTSFCTWSPGNVGGAVNATVQTLEAAETAFGNAAALASADPLTQAAATAAAAASVTSVSAALTAAADTDLQSRLSFDLEVGIARKCPEVPLGCLP